MPGQDTYTDEDELLHLPVSAGQYGLGWREDAACRGMDTQLFFPVTRRGVLEAKRVCARCAVQNSCLAFALSTGQRSGIWGGRDEDDLWKLRRRRRSLRRLRDDEEVNNLESP